MYNELIKRLQDFAAGTMRDKDAQLAFDAINAIEELICEVADKHNARLDAEERQRWIPVTERLPDVFKHVLVNIPGMAPHPTVQEAFREKNGLWYSNGFRYEADEITHWMQLPQLPKEEV